MEWGTSQKIDQHKLKRAGQAAVTDDCGQSQGNVCRTEQVRFSTAQLDRTGN